MLNDRRIKRENPIFRVVAALKICFNELKLHNFSSSKIKLDLGNNHKMMILLLFFFSVLQTLPIVAMVLSPNRPPLIGKLIF